MAALFIPGIMLATGFLLPTADPVVAKVRFDRLQTVVGAWPVRIILFLVIFLALFHCAHRARHTLMDLGLRQQEGLLMTVCYVSALVGTVAAAVVLIQL